ncbi:MAG: amino acid ABC transporter ATP-binding protein [Aeromonas sp.]
MITLQGLRKSFAGHTVLDGVDLSVALGEIVAIIGPSGSGKSTLLRCLNLLERPEAGQLTLAGQTLDLPRASHAEAVTLRQQFAFVFQNFALFAHQTARENIAEGLITVRGQRKAQALAQAEAVLAEVGLADKAHAYPRQLSGGQQQRVAIGRAMATGSPVILLDEPTSALDPERVGEVLQLMRQLAAKQQTMLLVTHEIAFAREVADRVIFMADGRIVEQGRPDQVLEAPRDPRTQAFLGRRLRRA